MPRPDCRSCAHFRICGDEPDMVACTSDRFERVELDYHLVVRTLPAPARRAIIIVPERVTRAPVDCGAYRAATTAPRVVSFGRIEAPAKRARGPHSDDI